MSSNSSEQVEERRLIISIDEVATAPEDSVEELYEQVIAQALHSEGLRGSNIRAEIGGRVVGADDVDALDTALTTIENGDGVGVARAEDDMHRTVRKIVTDDADGDQS